MGKRIRHLCPSALLAAATLAGCASSSRMERISPFSEQTATSSAIAHAEKSKLTGPSRLDDDRVNAFPLYYTAGGMHSAVWPIVDWDDRGMAVRPFYNRDGDNQSVLFPFTGWDDKGGWAFCTAWNDDKGFLFIPLGGTWDDLWFAGPVYAKGDSTYGVFPLFFRNDDTWQVLNTVVIGRADKTPDIFVLPLWHSHEQGFWVAELYSQRLEDGGVSRRSLLGTLYHEHENADQSCGHRWLFPVGLHVYEKDFSAWFSLPVSAGHEGRESWFNVHPLWWSHSDCHGDTQALLPLWYHSRHDGREMLLTPLGGYGTDEQGRRDRLNVLGVAYHGSDAEGTRHHYALWPLLGRGESATEKAPDTLALAAWSSSSVSECVRLSPLLSLQDGESDEGREWWHLAHFGFHKNGYDCSITPILGAERRGERMSAQRLWPVFRRETNGDGTVQLRLFPLYGTSRGGGFWERLCFVNSDRRAASFLTPEKVTETDRYGWLLARRETMRRSVEAAPLFDVGEGTSQDRFVTLLTTAGTTERLLWKADGPTPAESETLRDYLLRDAASGSGAGLALLRRSMRNSDKVNPSALRADTLAILAKHGRAMPADAGAAAIESAVRSLAKDCTRTVTETEFAVDPLGIPLYTQSEDDKARSWRFLFGVAGGLRTPESSRTRVLAYLYDRETGPDGSRMNCIPFISRDDTTAKSSVAFLWRVFHRETDKSTGKSSGHILFIPY